MSRIGPYRLGVACGVGGEAIVYEAWRDGAHSPVALKFPRPDRVRTPAVADALRREAALLARLRHPHIVAALDADPSHPYLAMALLPGGSVPRVIRSRAPLPPDTVAAMLRGAADALDWLHAQDIVHGDIKPANLLLGADGTARLIDFGTAAPRGAAVTDRVATPAYAAPERLLGLAPDPRDDIFSLAAVAYALLTGQPPFGDDPVLAVGVPPRPATLADAAWHRLRSALVADRMQRPWQAADLIAALATSRRGALAGCPD